MIRSSRRFRDREEAGRLLGTRLAGMFSSSPVVLGLPRGGVVVAAEVAKALQAPLDVILVRKLGVPFQPELAMGAIGEHGVRILNDGLVAAARLSSEDIDRIEKRERANLDRAARMFRGGGQITEIAGRSIVIVDDGIATGATVRGGCEVARLAAVKEITVAAPVASLDAVTRLEAVADKVVVLAISDQFLAISQYYEDFAAVENEVVVGCLAAAASRAAGGAAPPR